MKKSRYSEEQVAYTLRLAESGTPVADVWPADGHCRGDVLSLEEEVQRLGCIRSARVAADARGECPP